MREYQPWVIICGTPRSAMNLNEKLISSEFQFQTLISQVFWNIIFSDCETEMRGECRNIGQMLNRKQIS